ncbi:sensor histidine kinase [Sphaerisporangium fuscum]|uniref:sensor histidine kinase n=1 Tax=Sphaerisporangium fuscum TaxID=2835868 RepID=UPI0027E2A9EB|nr:sensor histidine kinase [Sphaerisporangium fuscum]
MTGRGEGDRRRGTLSILRTDLWTLAADPLPRMGGPRWTARLPHVLVVLYALVMVQLTHPRSPAYGLLATMHAAALVVAMSRPVLAWWASTLFTIVGAQLSEIVIDAGPDSPWLVERVPPPPPGFDLPGPVPFPWTTAGILLQGAVLFLLALRVRPRAAAEALTISVLAALYCVVFIDQRHSANAVLLIPVAVTATVVGAALRGRRVARTRLVEQEEITAEERARRTVLETRNRIARELHDVVAHHMSVISIQAQVAPHLVDDPSEELKENLAGIRQNAVEALTELRRVLGVLRSEDALADGVRHAPQPTLDRLGELVANVRAAGVTVTVETTGQARPLSPGVELSAFRIVQEALSNVMRHAPGAAVRVSVAYGPEALTVRVVNTAPAGPVPPSKGAGHGLLGMRERTTMLGGDLATGGTPDGGYEVTAVLPAPAGPVQETGSAPQPPPDRAEEVA